MKTVEEELKEELKGCKYGERWESLSAQLSCLEAAGKVADEYIAKKKQAG